MNMKIALFGVGQYIDEIEKLLQKNVEIVCYIDNNPQKQAFLRHNKIIYSIEQCRYQDIDYIVISALKYISIEKQLIESGWSVENIIPFFKENLIFEDYETIFQPLRSVQYSLECRMQYSLKQLERKQKYIEDNLIYEMADKARRNGIKLPKICTVEETCNKIVKDRVSLSRFGDGEFQIIFGASKTAFQDNDSELGRRLEEILMSDIEGHIVALADDYGCMEGFRDENKDTIRKYMTKEIREKHYQYIDMNKQYYNAYISRPYVIYPYEEREQAKRRFMNLKEIWKGKKVVLVEGNLTRMGVGNDLFDNVVSLERIIAPNKNAFSVYSEILNATLHVEKDKLILIALGPTATVLAYDLAKKGYWAIDIGHLDLEYEWFLKGEGYSRIPTKYNNEVLGDEEVIDICDEGYNLSIIDVIEKQITVAKH